MYLASRRGDYLQGYRGDPGILGSIWSGIKSVGRIATPFLPGPVRGIAEFALGRGGPSRPAPPPMPRGIAPGISMPGRYSGRVGQFEERRQGYEATVTLPGTTAAPGAGCPKGYRLNKTSYFLKNGTYVPAGTKCVKYRYRNVANGKALRRAIGRAGAFERLVKRNRKSLRALSKI